MVTGNSEEEFYEEGLETQENSNNRLLAKQFKMSVLKEIIFLLPFGHSSPS
jgi:hypothetical protein